jgi:hypothetical protein
MRKDILPVGVKLKNGVDRLSWARARAVAAGVRI